ncbi:hypothetical protein HK104_010771 [Borealophlyctis nickersoniae]|nr:hypothetical protein HK104_010771 [Borealophlyctis nickersoniae]
MAPIPTHQNLPNLQDILADIVQLSQLSNEVTEPAGAEDGHPGTFAEPQPLKPDNQPSVVFADSNRFAHLLVTPVFQEDNIPQTVTRKDVEKDPREVMYNFITLHQLLAQSRGQLDVLEADVDGLGKETASLVGQVALAAI